MKKEFVIGISIVLGGVFCSANAASNVSCQDARCVNNDTKAFWGLTFTPSYKNYYDISLIGTSDSCDDDPASVTMTVLPKNSYYRQTLDRNSQTPNEMYVHVYKVDELDDSDPATDNTNLTEEKYFNTPFKACINGKNGIQKSNYKRVGGVSTGLLVVPFKFRKGDIYSDSAIGPYISYKWEVIELLASGGLSQISVSEVGSEKVESKTGLTYAIGVNFEIENNWDIAFVVGKDHLSGDLGKEWEFQDKTWWSFAIGYNFTR